MRRYGLRDDQFARVEHLLPGGPGHVERGSALGNRLFVEAVIWKFRSSAPWRDLPERFGAWKNIHARFSRWAKSRVWESLFKTLADDPDHEYAIIDATIVRAHQHSAGALKKGRRSSHRPLARPPNHQDPCDRRRPRQPVGARLTGRQAHDITQAEALAAEAQPEALLGDKGYDADAFIESLEARAC